MIIINSCGCVHPLALPPRLAIGQYRILKNTESLSKPRYRSLLVVQDQPDSVLQYKMISSKGKPASRRDTSRRNMCSLYLMLASV